jgi:hypothetical protein
MSTGSGASPGRRCWLTAVVLVALALFGAMAAESRLARAERRSDVVIDEAQPASAPPQMRIVGVGTSLLRQATEPSADMVRLFSEQAGRPVSWTLVDREWIGGDITAEAISAVEGLKYTPDLLLLHVDLFASSGAKEANLARPTEGVETPLSRLRMLGMMALQREQKARPRRGCLQRSYSAERLGAQIEPFYAEVYLPPEIEASLVRMQARGTRIALLNLPRAPEVEHVLKPVHDAWLARLMARLSAIQPELISFPQQETQAYCDGAHLNVGGRRVSSSWLVRRITQGNG